RLNTTASARPCMRSRPPSTSASCTSTSYAASGNAHASSSSRASSRLSTACVRTNRRQASRWVASTYWSIVVANATILVGVTIDVPRARARPHTRLAWLDSWHSFSFGHHWDPANTHHGLLVVSSDDVIAPATGFDTHPHRDMEIVTWVLEGELEHRD